MDLTSDQGVTKINLHEAALSASGTSIQGAHIIPPDGWEVDESEMPKRMWVVSPDGSAADAWSTALMLMTPGEMGRCRKSGKRLSKIYVEKGAEIIDLRTNLGVDVAVVVGGGNFWRGREGSLRGMDATQSDHIGMLGTVMNALALQDALERQGQETRVQSAIEMPRIAEAYIRRRAVRHLEKGRVVIFAAGTGNPFFTTDTAAALRAAEIEADVVIKGTHSGVDGIYSADPRIDDSAVKYDEVSYMEVMTKDLKVMDTTAIAFCRENDIPIVVFDMSVEGSLRSIVQGGPEGTLVRQ